MRAETPTEVVSREESRKKRVWMVSHEKCECDTCVKHGNYISIIPKYVSGTKIYCTAWCGILVFTVGRYHLYIGMLPLPETSSPGWHFVLPSQIPANTLKSLPSWHPGQLAQLVRELDNMIQLDYFFVVKWGWNRQVLGDLWGDGFALCSLPPWDTRAIYSNMIRGPLKFCPGSFFSLGCKKIQQPAFLADGWLRNF